jgi:hypothetical protein
MAINTFPAVASPVKSVQRGSAAGAGTVTITAIDISKSMVHVFGTASSGTVSASFSLNSSSLTMVGTGKHFNFITNFGYGSGPSYPGVSPVSQTANPSAGDFQFWTVPATMNAMGVTGGSTNLIAGVVQGYLSGSTSLVVSGACRWEVVEYN